MGLRERIYQIIEKSEGNDYLSSMYDIFMIIAIIISIIPLGFKEDNLWFQWIENITVSIFILDYFLRLITADFHFNQKHIISFIKYPLSFMGIIDLLSILPSINIFNNGFKLLRIFRMIRAMRVIRIFKVMRYSKSFMIINEVLRDSSQSLVAVGILAFGYIIVSALIIFNVEPDSFKSFFDAVYWSTVSLTTVGYGDIYPVSTIGRLVAMLSSIFGIAVVALPAGIITAGYMHKLDELKNKRGD